MQNKNLDAFEARLKRIAKDEAGPRQLLAGEGEVTQSRVHASDIKRAQKPKRTFPIKQIPKIGLGFIAGVVTMLAGRLIGFHVLSAYMVGNEMKTFLMLQAAELAAATVLLVIVAMLFKLNTGAMKTAMVAGVAFMLVGEPEVAKHVPTVWQEIFSPNYAASVLAPQASLENNLRSIAGVVMTSL